MKATDVLEKAAKHMSDRAATYDKPEGERSMAKTVAAFNAITGQDLTTAEGWEFMAVLKQVRAFQNPAKPHVDSLEDGPAYLALLAEEMTSGEKDHSSAPNGDGWIPWNATSDSECPVDPRSRVRVRLANGNEVRGAAECYRWKIGSTNGRTVVAYFNAAVLLQGIA